MLYRLIYEKQGIEERMLVEVNAKRLSTKQAARLLQTAWYDVPRSQIVVKSIEKVDEGMVPPWDEVKKTRKKKKRKLTTYLDDMEAHDMEMMEAEERRNRK